MSFMPIAPLSFPPPPPAPQRPASSASWKSVEPTIDELKRETFELKTELSQITSNLTRIETLREQVTTAPVSEDQTPALRQLASLTSSTGEQIVSLAAPLASLSARTDALAARAREGRAAATTMEVEMISEELEVVKLSVKEAIERVRGLAWEEVDGRELTRERLEKRIRMENPGMGEDGVQSSVKQALAGAESRVAKLDISSYAGRLAAESPFTELAQVIDAAQQLRRETAPGQPPPSASLSRASSFRSQTTLVGSVHTSYDKVELGEDLESQPLANNGADWPVEGQTEKKKGKWAYLVANWRDVLVRCALGVAVVGTVVGIVVFESIDRASTKADAAASALISA